MFSVKRIRLAAIAVAVAVAATGIGVGLSASASAATHGPVAAHHSPAKPKVSVNRLNLSGFVVDAKYTLGRNAGNTFQQAYQATTSQGVPVAGPDVGTVFPAEDYVALRISPTQVYITWLDPATFAIVDVFVMNLATRSLYDYAPGSAAPESAGSITVLHWGSLRP